MPDHSLHFCFCSDEKYVQHLSVAIASVISCHQGESVGIHVLDSGISEKSREKIRSQCDGQVELEWYPVRDELFEDFVFLQRAYFTPSIFYRILIPRLLGHLERVLYLDVDLIVLRNLRELYNTPLHGKPLAMVADWDEEAQAQRISTERYYNSGVILFDMATLKDFRLESKCREVMSTSADMLLYPDQDILNIVCRDAIHSLSYQYNTQSHADDADNENFIRANMDHVAILHYTGRIKPWSSERASFEYFYFRYLRKTAWKHQALGIRVAKWRKKFRLLLYNEKRLPNYKYVRYLFFSKERKETLRIYRCFGIPILQFHK